MGRFFSLAAAALCALLWLCGCDESDREKPSGETLVLGYENFAPYLFAGPDGKPTGYDYDLACEVARRNGWKPEFRVIPWQDKERLLAAGEIDCIWGGMKLTAQRRDAFLCSKPYLLSAEVVIATKASGIQMLSDLPGRTLAVERNTPDFREFTEGSQKELGAQLKELVTVDGFDDLRTLLDRGEVDAVATDYLVASHLWRDNPAIAILPKSIIDTWNVIGFKAGRNKLCAQVEKTLEEMKADGTLARLAEKWFGKDISIAGDNGGHAEMAGVDDLFESRKILVVHSDSVYFERARNVFEGFSAYLRGRGFNVTYDVIEFNVAARPDHLPSPDAVKLLRDKLRENRYSMVAVCNNAAADLFLDGKVTPPPGTPVVFLAYRGDFARRAPPGLGVTGVITPFTEIDNMYLAFDLCPGLDKFILISSSLPADSVRDKLVREAVPLEYKDRVEIISGEDTDNAELLGMAAHLSANSVIFMASWDSAKDDFNEDAFSMLPRIREATGALILGKYDAYRYLGADGGVLISSREQGRLAGRLAERIFLGEDPRSIAPLTAPVRAEIDYSALKRHGIPPELLPSNLMVVGAPGSALVRYWKEGALAFGALLVLAVWSLLRGHRRKLQLERTEEMNRKLQSSKELLDHMLDSMPVTVFAKRVDDGFKYAMANSACAKFLNRSKHEILGHVDADLFPPEAAAAIHGRDVEIAATGGTVEFFEEIPDPRGNIHHMRCTKMPLVGVDGEKLQLGVLVDITRMHNLVESEKVVNSALTRIALEPDFDKALDCIAEIMQKHTNCDRVCVMRRSESGMWTIYREWLGEDIENCSDKLKAAYFEVFEQHLDSFGSGRIIRIPDVRSHEWLAGLPFDPSYKIKSFIAAPIWTDSKFQGLAIVSFAKRLRNFTSVDDDLMRATANIISLALARHQQRAVIDRYDRENQLILDNIKNPIWLFGADGELLRVNREVVRLSGVPAEKLTTRLNYRMFAKFLGSERPVAGTIHTGEPAQLEVKAEGRDFIVNSEPVKDPDGSLRYVVLSATDVTVVNALFANEKVVNVCFETMLREHDMNKAIQLILKAVCEHLGASHGCVCNVECELETFLCFSEYSVPGHEKEALGIRELLYAPNADWRGRMGRSAMAAIPDTSSGNSDGISDTAWLSRARQLGISSIYAHRVVADSRIWGYVTIIYHGRTRNFSEWNKKFIGAVAGFIGLMVERHKAHQRIMDALHAAEAADRAKSYFLASMSHEIRTPLNAVIGFSELLGDGTLPESTRQEYLSGIAFAGNSLLALINDVLDLSKLEAGQMLFVPVETDFEALAREVGGIFRPKCLEHGLSLGYEIDPIPPVYVDKLRLRQILFNLIGNALKFTLEGEIRVAASFTPDGAETGTLVFSVIDTGIGIAPEDRERIFEPFVQASAMRGTHAAANGTGLGLAIVKRMLGRMNGGIELESEPGKGSCFKVTLRGLRYGKGVEAAPPAAPSLPEARRFDISVLLVDDVPMNLKVMAAILLRLGAKMETASGGAEALKLLEKFKADIVLTDLWMPEITGAELAKLIAERSPELPVVAVTADADSRATFDMSVFRAILVKPVTVEKVADMLKTVMK